MMTEAEIRNLAQSINDSDAMMAIFAAPEWDELGDDGKEWVCGLVRETLRHAVSTPETAEFMAGVPLEAAHQRDRWPTDHDAGKSPFDWFWLIGYLAQKAAASAVAGDIEKAKHHTISTAGALANWHAALTGADNQMRPGIEPPCDTTVFDPASQAGSSAPAAIRSQPAGAHPSEVAS